MTRPKVDPDKRQRTAQACDSCKRRKQKCNGLNPCNTCTKRSLECTYGPSDHGGDDQQPSPKKSKTESTHKTSGSIDSIKGGLSPPDLVQGPTPPQYWSPNQSNLPQPLHRPQNNDTPDLHNPMQHGAVFPSTEPEEMRTLTKTVQASGSGLLSRASTADGPDEEAVVYNSTRMLQDPTGRLLYVGDAATLSFLQLIRMIVDNVVGPTPFTMDPKRHRIVESSISLPPNIRRTHLLPDRQTANVLVEAYFTNTNGLAEIFQRRSFMTTLDACYTDPLNVDPSWLCLLYLTFAIGLVMASPLPGTKEYAIIQKLRSESIDRAEVFYSDAKNLSDPSTGFEDAGFWSIQALTLMSVYMLAVSKRNAAYAYYGMAVRSAFALGLHREETMVIFSSAEQAVRRNLWRSLFVLDRFLSASLGRPTAIRESDCSGSSLATGDAQSFPQAPFPTATHSNVSNSAGLEASVRTCQVVGVILDKVYSKRKISTRLAQEIADDCKGWPKQLDPSLHWRQADSADPAQGIAILHVNLLYCHSIVLLTRPFFLFLMNKAYQERQEGQKPQKHARIEKFAEACVTASSHTIALVQNALEGRYLPHRNPFVLYFLFAAALVVMSNEFAALYPNPTSITYINNAINIMNYCAQHDPQASRLLFILTSFRDVILRHRSTSSLRPLAGLQSQPFNQTTSMPNDHGAGDPIVDLLQATTSPDKTSNPIIPHLRQKTSNPHEASPQMTSDTPSKTLNGSSSSDHRSLNRDSSLDAFLDLARQTSNHSAGSNDGNESHSAGDAEIDFEMLWQWPPNSGVTPGPSALGFTPGDGLGLMGSGNSMVQVDIQGVSDSSVPLFGMSNADFGGI